MSEDHLSTTVIGVGNILCSDDGFGVYAVERLAQEELPAHVRLVSGGTDVWFCLEEALQADVVLIIDTLKTGSQPGTIYLVELAELDWEMGAAQHQFNLIQLLRLYQKKGNLINGWVIGIEPENLDLGHGLSPTLTRQMEVFIQQTRELISPYLPFRKG